MNNLCLTLGHRFAGVEKNGSAASLHASDRHRKASMKPKRPRVDSSAGALLLRRTLWYEFFILCSHVWWHQRSPSRQLGEEKSALSLLGGTLAPCPRTWCQSTPDHWAEPAAKVPALRCCYPIVYANASAFINSIARILRVQLTLIKLMCLFKLLASTACARLQFLLSHMTLMRVGPE